MSSKKRDALRRGIRALIQDTSEELAALDGGVPANSSPLTAETRPRQGGTLRRREAPPPAEPPADEPDSVEPPPIEPPAPGINGISLDTRIADLPAPVRGPTEEGTHRAPPHRGPAPADAGPRPAADDTAGGGADAPTIVRRPAQDLPEGVPEGRGRVVWLPGAGTLHVDPPAQEPAAPESPAPAAKPPRATPAAPERRVSRAQKSKRRARAAGGARARRAPRTTDEPLEPVPIRLQSKTGVCASYFVNHECWRVPGAYCTTALQVCVIRKCPVYQLNKEALERRFARKFKHLW